MGDPVVPILRLKLLTFLVLVASVAPMIQAADAVPSQPPQPGDELTISVLTFQPGDEIWEKFGHNAIWVHDESIPDPLYRDAVYNWGLFDFNAPHFYSNFIFGVMEYWMEPEPLGPTVDFYRSQNRTIWAQRLNLSATQKLRLRNFLEWNARPENRFYRYDYYRDNCSTRVRDAIDLAADGQLEPELAKPCGTTYRWHTRRLTRDSLFWYTTLNTVLGPNTDKPISQWQECFLPLKLMEHLRHVTIKDDQGRPMPLVAEERALFTSTRSGEPVAPPNWIVRYLIGGILIGLAFVVLGLLSRRGRAGRIASGIVFVIYSLIVGLLAWLSLWAWGFSHHWSSWGNENLFGYSPLLLPMVVLIPMSFRAWPRLRRWTLWLALIIAVLTIIGCILCPLLPQVNAEPMMLILPINLGLAAALWLICAPNVASRAETPA